MNVNAIKGMTWIAALGVAGYLGYFIFDFWEQKPVLEKPLSRERQKEILDDVPPPREDERDLVAVGRVKEVFGKDFDWTGKPPPPPPPPRTSSNIPSEKPKIPVADMVRVLYTWAHDTDPTDRFAVAFVSYTGVLSGLNDKGDSRTLRVGGSLPNPQNDIKVKEIGPDSVVFSFADGKRADETLASLKYDPEGRPGIVQVAEGQEAAHPIRKARIQRRTGGPAWRQPETSKTGKHEYQLGTESLQEFNKNYGEILSRDVKTRQHRNPRTGEIDGVQVTHVSAGSLPSSHGLSKGDVIKSINGHRVTSVNGAINYVKANADTTTKWIAIIERQGRDVTVTYNSPAN